MLDRHLEMETDWKDEYTQEELEEIFALRASMDEDNAALDFEQRLDFGLDEVTFN